MTKKLLSTLLFALIPYGIQSRAVAAPGLVSAPNGATIDRILKEPSTSTASGQSEVSVGDLLHVAGELIDKRKFKEAKVLARKILSLDNTVSLAHSLLAYTLLQEGNDKEAMAEATRAVELDPKSHSGWLLIAQNNMEHSEWKKALKAWETLKSLSDDDWGALQGELQCYQALKDVHSVDEVIADLNAVNQNAAKKHTSFCREFFFVNGYTVRAYQAIDPRGQVKKFFYFLIFKQLRDESPAFVYAFNELEADTQFARQQKKIGPDLHRYSLDCYLPGGSQSLVSMHDSKSVPQYPEVRDLICENLTKLGNGKEPPTGVLRIKELIIHPATSKEHDLNR